MKRYAALFICFLWLVAGAQLKTLVPGAAAPSFKLRNVDNRFVSFADYPNAKGFILVFTCNTCPYSKAYEARVQDLNKKFAPLGFPVVAINPNDPHASPGDAFQKMQERARAKNYTFPYLYDEGQTVTAAYGPRSTPHVFVIAKTDSSTTVVYSGAVDNDLPNNSPGKISYVEEAVTALLQGKTPAVTSTKAIGCRIAWKASTQ